MDEITLTNIYNKEVTLKIVDNENDANFITHAGTFHADEIMSTVILLNKFGDIKLARVNNVNNNDKAFIYDIGYGKYDHHGADFNITRENNIKYASCGLIWNEFGKDILSKLKLSNIDEAFKSIDNNIIMDIDRDDNGIALKNEPDVKMQNIPSLISSFNPAWNELECETKSFLNAVSFANTIFNNIINKMVAKDKAKSIIDVKIDESRDGILLLDEYMPWKDIVLTSANPKAKEILYAIFPSKRGGYNIVATPEKLGSFNVKKPFPEKWAGKEEKELQQISGIKTITFCHVGLFICACKTFEDAILIAKTAINNKC